MGHQVAGLALSGHSAHSPLFSSRPSACPAAVKLSLMTTWTCQSLLSDGRAEGRVRFPGPQGDELLGRGY